MVGRQTPLLALFVPLILVGMVDGMRGVRQAWPAALVGGLVFAIAQFACSNYISVELTDIVASLLATGAIVALLQVWQPSEPLRGERLQRGGPAIAGAAVADRALEAEVRRKDDDHPDTRGEIFGAYAPYLIIIAVFAIAQSGPIKDFLDGVDQGVRLAGPRRHERRRRAAQGGDVQVQLGQRRRHAAAGLRPAHDAGAAVSPGRALRVYGETLDQLKWATLTVATVLALAYVMNLSGQTITLGLWIAGAGGILAFLSSIIGWLGVAVTGSDTQLELAVRRAAGVGGQGGRARPDAAGRGELLRRRARQDDLAAEPRDRRRGGRARRPGGRAVPARAWLEHRCCC